MRTVNISHFISTIKCSRCGNKAVYDDTPYHRMQTLKDLDFEIGCPICGNRDIYDKQFRKIN